MKFDSETEIVTITWKMADILEAMEIRGLEATEPNVRRVLDYSHLKALEEQSIERGWEVIYRAVDEVKMKGRTQIMTPNESYFAISVGAKKYIDYTEGQRLYGLGRSKFIELAKEANAVRDVRGRKLVHIETLENYIELMFGPGKDVK